MINKVISDTRVPVKIWATDLEPEAEQQVRNIANLPFISRHVAVMPDAHAGKGSTVGTVIATKGAIIPAAVGVDIGCGMTAVRLPVKIDAFGDNLDALRHSIERSVPVGFNQNKEVNERVATLSLWDATSCNHSKFVSGDKAALQLGTLGGGNHFIELCYDEENYAWVVLHSGSRNAGKVLADRHINGAKGLMKKYFIDLPDPDLAYLVEETESFHAYIDALHWAQDYAKANRNEMMLRVLTDISRYLYGEPRHPGTMITQFVDCHHNYTAKEEGVWVTRKGAVSAQRGELGIIPGSMGTKSYIVKGLGNRESFCSCSHGAGRRMSRTKARATFTVEDLAQQTAGVNCRKDDGVLDEIPSSYKSIDEVMANQADLVEVVHTLKQVLCVKG